MSERKPPQNPQSEHQSGETPEWIDELYAESADALPPNDLDAQILQAAAKKSEAPRSRLSPPRRWLGALASAAVLVMTVGVFLSGELTDQELQPASRAPAAMELQRAAPTAPASTEGREPDEATVEGIRSKSVLQMQAQVQPREESVRQPAAPPAPAAHMAAETPALEQVIAEDEVAELAPAAPQAGMRLTSSNRGVGLFAERSGTACDTVVRGICVTAQGLYALDPQCSDRLRLPDAAVVIDAADAVFRDGQVRQRARCINGAWQIESPPD